MLLLWILINSLVNPGFEFLLQPKAASVPFPTEVGVLSILSNPAGLGERGSGILFNHSLTYLDSYHSLIAIKWGNIAGFFDYYNFGGFEYQGTSPNDNGGPKFTPYATQIRIAYGFQVDPETYTGLAATVLYQRILSNSLTQVYLSGGIIYMPKRINRLRVALMFDNLGPRKRVNTESVRMPVKIGGAIDYSIKGVTLGVNVNRVFGYERGQYIYQFRGLYRIHRFVDVWGIYSVGSELISPIEAGARLRHYPLVVMLSFSPSRLDFDTSYRISILWLL